MKETEGKLLQMFQSGHMTQSGAIIELLERVSEGKLFMISQFFSKHMEYLALLSWDVCF